LSSDWGRNWQLEFPIRSDYSGSMSGPRKAVVASAFALLALWLGVNFDRLTADPNGVIRFVLCLLFSVLILRRRGWAGKPLVIPPWGVPGTIGTGTVLALLGIVFRVHQFEWLGLVLLFAGCLLWGLPPRFTRNVVPAVFVLYWMHPLPGQVFGPLQLGMQRISIAGAEWFLHTLNVRIWADGLILRTGYRTFGVPEACSGMRTVVTVLLCTLGVGILYRFRWREIFGFALAGVGQALALNVVRIAGMVLWSPSMPPEWSKTFLHDTMGLFLLAVIAAVQIEMSWWKRAKTKRFRAREERRQGERPRRRRTALLPKAWRRLIRWGTCALLVAAFFSGTSLAFYKKRPAHRAAMIAGAVDGLMATDLASAEAGIEAALKLTPRDRELLSKRARILVRRRKFEKALTEFNCLPTPLDTTETILKSRALTALDRLEEAMSLIDTLPETMHRLPGVLLVKAEHAVRLDRPQDVARDVVLAARDRRLVDRVRAFFPYLARHGQWRAIVRSDAAAPYRELAPALIAIEANLRLGNREGAESGLERAVRRWPKDPGLLGALFAVASAASGAHARWEAPFAENLTANIGRFDADHASVWIDNGFKLGRPDLAWLAYSRLAALAPNDPRLPLAAARYGVRWFRFHGDCLGIVLPGEEEAPIVDLCPVCLQTKRMQPFAGLWRRVPLAREVAEGLTQGTWPETRQRFLDACLAGLEQRRNSGTLTPQLSRAHVRALVLAGRFEEVHAKLEEMAEAEPALRASVLLQHATLYASERRWQEAYEVLTEYSAALGELPVAAAVLQARAMMSLNLGIAALDILERAIERHPDSGPLQKVVASVWAAYGFYDQALFILRARGLEDKSPAMARLLTATGRYAQARALCRAAGIRVKAALAAKKDPLVQRPAEFSLLNRWPAAGGSNEMAAAAGRYEQEARKAKSPFIRRLSELKSAWYGTEGPTGATEPWVAAGRNRVERGTALHHLAVLLGRQGDHAAALRAVLRALEFVPGSPVLRRVQIVLTEGERQAVEEARAACPNDPEIWLAYVVRRTRDDGAGDWAVEEMERAARENGYSVGTMVRAGDFLLRRGITNAALTAAQHAVREDDAFLPAWALGVRCGVAAGDTAWALECAGKGATMAVDPSPFQKAIVRIKSSEPGPHRDLIATLESLHERFPAEPEWTRRLAHLHFQNCDVKRASDIIEKLRGEGAQTAAPVSLLMASERFRVGGETEKAVDILRRAYREYPDRLDVLNNLVYTLAHCEETGSEARRLLPDLLAMGEESFAVLDTAAFVCLRRGELDLARSYIEKALATCDEESYAALQTALTHAEILCRSGRHKEAREALKQVRRHPAASTYLRRCADALEEELD